MSQTFKGRYVPCTPEPIKIERSEMEQHVAEFLARGEKIKTVASSERSRRQNYMPMLPNGAREVRR